MTRGEVSTLRSALRDHVSLTYLSSAVRVSLARVSLARDLAGEDRNETPRPSPAARKPTVGKLARLPHLGPNPAPARPPAAQCRSRAEAEASWLRPPSKLQIAPKFRPGVRGKSHKVLPRRPAGCVADSETQVCPARSPPPPLLLLCPPACQRPPCASTPTRSSTSRTS